MSVFGSITCWKDPARAVLCNLYKYTGALWVHEAVRRWTEQQFLTILLFHRVTDVIHEDGLTVSTARFRRVCRLLARSFRVVPLAEVFRIVRSGERMPERTVAVTFDDCYHDNLSAARVLAEHGLPATFFVPTAYVGTNRVFDWDRGLPKMPNLSWPDVQEMIRLGHEIGSHTVTHANLGAVGPDQARSEIFASKTILEDHLAQRVRFFAYPFGDRHHLRPEYVPYIAEAGYEGAVSAYGGFVEPGMDSTILPRKAMPPFRSLAHLEMFLSGCMHWLYTLKGRGNAPTPSRTPAGEADSEEDRKAAAGYATVQRC
jgi:peptidoglycan/xylan/chitin deacetylase (PgdA/CDA1 family)